EDGEDGWYVEGGAGTVTQNAHSGTRALRLPASGGFADQQITFEPGTTYELSAWGRLSASGDVAQVGVTYRNEDGERLTDQEPQPLEFTETTYQQQTLVFQP